MNGPKNPIGTYGSMVALPALIFLYAVSNLFWRQASGIFGVLAGLALLVFGLSGINEVLVNKARSRGELNPGTENAVAAKPGGKGTPVEFTISRFGSKEGAINKTTYTSKVGQFTSVLNALLDIKSDQDNSLSLRYSCNMGICGSCGMEINGKPALACETNALRACKDGKIEVSPMKGHPLLKDLVTDFDDFFEKHISVSPSLHRDNVTEKHSARIEYDQSQADVDKFLPYSSCIMCGLCLDACPVINSNPNFVGPQALSQAYRYKQDSRDQLGGRRLDIIDTMEGVWACEFAGSCSEVCPKGVGPAAAIQLLKAETMKRKVLGSGKDQEQK
jgi:succinate dehydrogenase / fumarate reductase, iron-sulfur subunit